MTMLTRIGTGGTGDDFGDIVTLNSCKYKAQIRDQLVARSQQKSF